MSVQKIELPFDVDLLPVRELAAGKLTCLYEKGNLRYIKWNGEEVVRMIYTAVRDQDWATAPYEISNEVIHVSENGFSISYTAYYQLNNIQYKAAVQIGARENSISFSMQGEALSNFLKNRIGICVHHPVTECAGKKVVITHPGGERSEAFFPEQISPHQPFKQVRAMEWEAASSAKIQILFEGDVFETEDQRNWTDYSFKTYSTPLDIPFPAEVRTGEKVQQKVTLNVSDSSQDSEIAKKEWGTAELYRLPFPRIGYERAPGSPNYTSDELLLLQEIPFDHYRVVLQLSDAGWIDTLDLAAAEAIVLGVQMEVVVFFPNPFNEEELTALSVNLQRFSEQLLSVLLLQEGSPVTPGELLQKAYPLLKAVLPQLKIGYGTDGFFADLNRNPPATEWPFDFVSYSINPQVHATDTRTLMENLAAQEDTVGKVRTFAPGKEIFISPLTFKIRADKKEDDISAADSDSRMYTSFGAMWTLLSVKALAGADAITLFQAKSYRGILGNCIAPEQNPLYQVLRTLGRLRPKWIVKDNRNRREVRFENAAGENIVFSFPDAEGW